MPCFILAHNIVTHYYFIEEMPRNGFSFSKEKGERLYLELAIIKLNGRKGSTKRHTASDLVGAHREIVAVGGGPSEPGDSMGLDLVPIWLS